MRRTYKYSWPGPPEGPPTPQTPFQCPHPDKKGTNLLLFKFCIHLHTHQDLKLKCCRVMGQKLRYGRPCTQYLPGTHNWLAQSHIASISSKFHYLMLAQSCEFGVNCCSIGLTHPAACTRAREPLAFGHVHRPPPLTQFAPTGCQSTGLELRIPTICFKFRENAPEKNWRPPAKKLKTCRGTTPPPPPRFDPHIYQSIALNLRIPNI